VTAADAGGLDNVGPTITNGVFFNYATSSAALACFYVTSTSAIISNNWCGGINSTAGIQYAVDLATGTSTLGGLAVTGNQFQTATTALIEISGFNQDVTITGNQIADGGLTGYGIRVENGGSTGVNQGTISGNTIQGPGTGTTWTGILISGGANNWAVGPNSIISAPTGINLTGTGTITVAPQNVTTVTTPIAGTNTNAIWNSSAIITFAQLPSAGNGSQLYVSDSNSACSAGSSNGRTCFRENGSWTH
jgi:hypothetical protein